MGFVEKRIEEREETVAPVEDVGGGGGDGAPEINLLGAGVDVGVRASERVEGTELRPAVAKLLVGFEVEAADVRADHWDAEEAGVEEACNGVFQVVPGCAVVARPVGGVGAGADEAGAG